MLTLFPLVKLILFAEKMRAAVLQFRPNEASSHRRLGKPHEDTPPSHKTPPLPMRLSTAPPPVSPCCLPGLRRPTRLSSSPVQDRDLDQVLGRELAHRQRAQLWSRCGQGRRPRCWRWTGGSGPGSSGKLPGPGSSAPRAGPAQTACVCAGTRSPSWCRS